MNKIIAALTLVLIFAQPILAGTPDKQLHEKCIYPTVLVFESGNAQGTGVIVRSEKHEGDQWLNVVVTAAHVVHDFDKGHISTVEYQDWSRIKPNSRKTYPIYVFDYDSSKDIAILFFLSKKKMPTAEIDLSQKFYIGNEVVGVGCAFADFPRIDFGRISGINNKFLRISMTTIPGDSGGPVFHNYKLIAIKASIRMITVRGFLYPIFQYSHHVPITQYVNWNNEAKGLSFVYDTKESLPKLPALMLEARRFEAPSPFESILQDLFRALRKSA